MVFISRDGNGNINGVFANRQTPSNEEVPDNDPAVVAFFAPRIVDPVDSWDLISLKIAFNHENRIRANEGKPAITLAQFKTAIRNMANPT